MRLIPIPHAELEAAEPYWLPFMDGIAAGSRRPLPVLLALARSGAVDLHLVWDDAAGAALALIGAVHDPDERTLTVVWVTGREPKRWLHLIRTLEERAKALGCVAVKAVGRLGYKPMMTALGYSPTHIVMEKDL